MTDEELLSLRAEGFIPGPGEGEPAFKERIHACLNLQQEMQEYAFKKAPDALNEALPITDKLYKIKPAWVSCLFSNHEMYPWHGGCAWIFQKEENSPVTTFLQLRKEFQTKKTLFRLYKRKELIAHELIHAGRMAFSEPKYEEFFAYQTSSSLFQKTFGPIVRSSGESMVLVVTLFTLIVLDTIALFSGYLDLYRKLQWLKLLPIAMIGATLLRLFVNRRTFLRAKENIGGLANLYALTDSEIEEVSSLSKEEVFRWVEDKAPGSLRLRQLLLWIRR